MDTWARALDTRARALDTPDPDRSSLYGLDLLQAEAAWTRTRGQGATVAVLDTGVDGTYPDLVSNVATGQDLVTGSEDGWADGNGHGTHVAGTIAAVAGNGLGVAGLAPLAISATAAGTAAGRVGVLITAAGLTGPLAVTTAATGAATLRVTSAVTTEYTIAPAAAYGRPGAHR